MPNLGAGTSCLVKTVDLLNRAWIGSVRCLIYSVSGSIQNNLNGLSAVLETRT